MKHSELVFVGVLVAIAAAGAVLVDMLIPASEPARPSPTGGEVISSGWYCPAPPGGEEFQSAMAIANVGDDTLGLRRFAVGGAGQSEVAQGNLEASRENITLLSDFKVNDGVGVVDAFGGESVANLISLSRGKGVGASRCSAQPSNRWLFATGSTARGENHYLLVANPFREEAVINVRFLTPDREVVPARLKDLVIPAQSQSTVFLSDYFVESPAFGLDITAQQGRVVVSRYSQITRAGAKGVSLDVGVGAPATSWTFAEGERGPAGEESLVVINPGTREALVGVVFMTGSERTAPPALTEVPVPAGRQVTIKTEDHIPEATSYGISLSSTNGEPVVAERVNTASVDRSSGYATSFGTTSPAMRWALPVGSPAGGNARLSIVNPGDSRTSVRVTLLGGDGEMRPDELSNVALDPGRKVSFDLTPMLNGGLFTAVVESTRSPVAAEARLSLTAPYADVSYHPGQPLR